jgi:hypothetical protein
MHVYEFPVHEGVSVFLSEGRHLSPEHPDRNRGYRLRTIVPEARAYLDRLALDPAAAMEGIRAGGWWVLSPADLRADWRMVLDQYAVTLTEKGRHVLTEAQPVARRLP